MNLHVTIIRVQYVSAMIVDIRPLHVSPHQGQKVHIHAWGDRHTPTHAKCCHATLRHALLPTCYTPVKILTKQSNRNTLRPPPRYSIYCHANYLRPFSVPHRPKGARTCTTQSRGGGGKRQISPPTPSEVIPL
jgi:hypothetical protein